MAISSDRISIFLMATGPRGSHKSLFLTSFQSEKLLKAHYSNYYLGTHKKVWSNYPVKFFHRSHIDHKVVCLESLPLNREALMMFDDEYVEGWVFIDEFDQWYDKQDWQDGSQKMTAKAITQIRKKKLNLGGTMQNINWANGRMEFQIDIQIECREAAFTPFGRKNGLDLGQCSFLTWKDLSGVNTGYMYSETKQVYHNMFWGEKYHNCYDTNFTFDPTESMTRYKIKRPVKEISFGNSDIAGELPGNKLSPNLVIFSDIINEFKKHEYIEVSRAEIQKKANEYGYTGDWLEAGKILSKLGVLKANAKGTKYNLETAR